jgi:hypothetical protein
MTHSGRPGSRPPNEDPQNRVPGWITGVLVTESIALAIAIVTPITPSKTGSTWSPANFFSTDPTYIEKVGASFVLVNALLLVLGLVAWVISRRGGSE